MTTPQRQHCLAISPDTVSEDTIYVIIGNTIRHLRKQAGMKQQELAEKLGLWRTSIVNIEAGRQHTPVHTLSQIAVIFGIPLHALFQEASLPAEDRTYLAQYIQENMQLRVEIIQLRAQLDGIRSILDGGSEAQS